MHWRHSEGIPKQLPFFPPVQPIFFQHQRLQHWTAVTVGNASSSERQPIVGRGDVIEYQSRRSRHQKLIQVERALHTCRVFTNDDNIFADNNFGTITLRSTPCLTTSPWCTEIPTRLAWLFSNLLFILNTLASCQCHRHTCIACLVIILIKIISDECSTVVEKDHVRNRKTA